MKKKLSLALCALSACILSSAQSGIYVGPNAALDIRQNTIFYAGGLVLQPASDYKISNTEMLISNDVANYTLQTYVSGVRRFSNPTPLFTGIVGYYYSDADLNGIPESNLGIKVHNGNYWQSVTTASRDIINNLVISSSVSNLALREIVLADEFVTLPVVWGPVQAIRNADAVRLNWSTRSESAVSHFQAERSLDGRTWLPVGTQVNARNQSGEQFYQTNDEQAPAQRLYYRIRQHDLDGRINYSGVVAVAAIGESIALQVFPNPTANSFRITGINPSQIQGIELYDARGAKIQGWTRLQAEYDIQHLASGVYHVRIQLQDGSTENKQIIKK